jgi:hypothetical protein
MKRLKKLIQSYRDTLSNDPESDLRQSFNNIAEVLDHAVQDDSDLHTDVVRCNKVLQAVLADMRDEDERNAKAAQKAAEVSGPPRA